MGCQGGERENTYHVSTVALEGNQEYSWPEPASFDPMHKLNPKVSMPCMATTDIQPREARGQRGGPGTKRQAGIHPATLLVDSAVDRRTQEAQRAGDHLQLDTDVERERERERESEREREREREGRERQAKREWHPTIPLGYSAINHQK